LGSTVTGTGAGTGGGLGVKLGVGDEETEFGTKPGELCGGTVGFGGVGAKEK